VLDPEVVLVSLLLVQIYKGEEECACFAMVIVVREEIQSIVVVVVPLTKGTKTSFLYV
jgi:hypothetical protein